VLRCAGAFDVSLRFDEYQDATEATAVYPRDAAIEGVDGGVLYTALGLVGEAGEVAEKVKKALREGDEKYLVEAEREVGDVLWYLARFCDERGVSLEDVAERNLAKLRDRQDRDALTGQGDER
jgi:NTP pyrophosphatase (non-canonical NTP hydrolase)